MVTQETTYVGGALCRIYEYINPEGGCRIATVNPFGQVFGYSSAIAFMEGESDYSNWEHRSTNAGNELAIAYVLGGK